MKKLRKDTRGYIALVTTLMVLTGVIALGVAMALLGVDELQFSYNEQQSVKAWSLAEACVSEGLRGLKEDAPSGYTVYTGGEIVVDDDSCEVSVQTSGIERIIQSTGTVGSFTRRIQVTVDVSSGVDIINWEEVGTF